MTNSQLSSIFKQTVKKGHGLFVTGKGDRKTFLLMLFVCVVCLGVFLVLSGNEGDKGYDGGSNGTLLKAKEYLTQHLLVGAGAPEGYLLCNGKPENVGGLVGSLTPSSAFAEVMGEKGANKRTNNSETKADDEISQSGYLLLFVGFGMGLIATCVGMWLHDTFL